MDKLKSTQTWVYAETIVWFLFILGNTVAGLSLLGLVKLSHTQQVFAGRMVLAFAFLALLYVTFMATKQRTK